MTSAFDGFSSKPPIAWRGPLGGISKPGYSGEQAHSPTIALQLFFSEVDFDNVVPASANRYQNTLLFSQEGMFLVLHGTPLVHSLGEAVAIAFFTEGIHFESRLGVLPTW